MFLCMASATILAQSSLHIELTAFTAKEMNGMVMINWTIESQKDCNYFTIERTGDGQSVTPVGIVDADGTTIQSMDYSFNDVNPETDTDYYYRIKETDFDGNTHTFHWIPVVKEQEESEFTVFPNPANSNITLNFPSNGKDAVCHILKEDGRIVEEQTRRRSSSYRRSHCSPGYLICEISWLSCKDVFIAEHKHQACDCAKKSGLRCGGHA